MTAPITVRGLLLALATAFAVCVAAPTARGGDLKLAIPRRSHATPVQELNREGVEAIRKHQYEKAKSYFYEAYLLDPDDPFTLNNLGFMAEMEGDLDRAQKFYSLSTQQPTDAAVDFASAPHLEGQSFRAAVAGEQSKAMRVSRANVEAIHLFSERRVMEADVMLQQTLKMDPNNAFTLNNVGVAKEMEGDFPGALKYYSEAAGAHMEEAAMVTTAGDLQGKPVSDVAAENVERLRKRMQTAEAVEARVALYNFQGVSAINRNQWQEAEQDFLQAYKVDPYDAFALNNLGFLSEMNGDLETAQTFYEDAQHAPKSNAVVGLATSSSAEGQRLSEVAVQSDQKVDTAIEQQEAIRRRETGPIQLKRRDGSLVAPEPATPSQPDNPSNAPQ